MSVSSSAKKTDDLQNDTTPISVVRIGEILKTAREKRKESLREAADNIKIRIAFLKNIENGQIDKLPGKVYALGFVRTYANYLGLDEHAVITTLKNAPDFSAETFTIGKVYDEPLPENNGINTRTALLSSLALIAVAIGGYLFMSKSNTTQPTNDNKLVLSTNTDTKVEVSLDQKTISHRFLKAGQTMQVIAIDGLEIKTDQPDSLTMTLNNESVEKEFSKAEDAEMSTMVYHVKSKEEPAQETSE